MAMRLFAVFAAVLLVGAFTLATVLPPDTPLAEVLSMLDRAVLGRIAALEHANLPAWMWNEITVPLLLRPVWLLPACLGVICGGFAVTLASNQAAQRSPRRRS